MTVVAPTTTELLGGTVPVRVDGFKFDLLDDAGNSLHRQLAVDATAPPTIENDTTRAVFRTINNVRIPSRGFNQSTSFFFADEIDPRTMRIAAYHVLASGEELPLGVFVFADDSQLLHTSGMVRVCNLADLGADLLPSIPYSLGYETGTYAADILDDLAAIAGFTDRSIEASTASAISAPIGWAAGRDTFRDAMNSVSAMIGYLPPYLDSTGTLICRAAPELTSAVADFVYGLGTVVIDGTVVLSGSVLRAPNQYVVLASNSVMAGVTGTFDIPADSPASLVETGVPTVALDDYQGLPLGLADEAARAAYSSDPNVYTTLAFSTPPDGRHDTFSIIEFDGVNYREEAWAMVCRAGAPMTHRCRGIAS